MNRPILVLVSVLSFFLKTRAQEDSLSISLSNYSHSQSIEYYNNHLYLPISKMTLGSGFEDSIYIVKLDLGLHIVDSIPLNSILPFENPSFMHIGEFRVIDSLLVVSAAYSTVESNPNCIEVESALLFLDENLNLVSRKIIPAHGDQLLVFDQSGDASHIVFSGAFFECGGIRSPLVGYYDLIQDSLNYISTHQVDTINDITMEAIGPFRHNGLLYFDLWPISWRKGFKSTLVLDEQLQLVSNGSAIDPTVSTSNIHAHGAFIPTNAGLKQLGLARTYPYGFLPPLGSPDGYWTIGVADIDSLGNIGPIDTFPLSGHNYQTKENPSSNHQFGFDGYAYNQSDSVFVIQNTKQVHFYNYTSPDSTSFFIYSLNLNNNTVNWSREVRRNAVAGDHGITILPGNKLAISFSENDSARYGRDNLIVHVWILDEKGSILSNACFPKRPSLNVYPNPCSEVLYLETKNKNQHYRLINASGLTVSDGVLVLGKNRIELGKLPEGFYQLQIDQQFVEKILIKR
jgi:hypothetical protein